MNTSQDQAGLIPDQLLSDVKQRDRVLFLGADLPLNYPDGPPSRPELAQALAAKYGLPPGKSWSETATAYLSKYPNDRHGLITFVRERCSGPQLHPGPLHRAIAGVGFRAIVTAWYDELLEEALRDAGHRVNRVVRDCQIPYAIEGEHEAIIIKLYGCLSDNESLVLDMWDHERLMETLSRKLELATAFCAIRPPLFVGFNLLERMPIRLYVRASQNMTKDMKRAYAVWPHELRAVQGAWYGQNVDFRRADATAFLEALAAQLPSAAVVREKQIRVQRSPYMFLDYYTAQDADIFCGRDTETQIVTRLALSHRLLTLFGPSGAGKTSLLLAGVTPQLAAWEYQHVYVRALDNPLAALRREIASRAGERDHGAGTLRTFLTATLAEGDRLVVVLDQFEELFIRVGSRARRVFFAQLAEALDAKERDVRVILSLREDYLAYLDEAREHLPDIFSNSYRLTALERGNARVAITEPAARAGVAVEPSLVDALVGTEGRRPSPGDGDPGDGEIGALVERDDYTARVFPAALQIVLDRLYRETLPAGHKPDEPPPPDLTLTLASYTAITHTRQREGEEAKLLRGAEAILAGYVTEGLAHLPANADLDLAREILKALVTGEETKAAVTRWELDNLLADGGAIQRDDRHDATLVDATLQGLQRVRLLRSFEREGAATYELTHDTLAKEIATWIDEAEMQTRMAREILRRALDNWRNAQLLIPLEALRLIHACCDDLQHLHPDELDLLFRSALAAGYEVDYWFRRAQAGGVDVDAIAREGLRSENFRTRAAAVTALGQLGEAFVDDLIGMLDDLYPQVRMAVIATLERLRPDGAWRKHLVYECYVPSGPFIMGDDESSQSDDKLAHEVDLDTYYISKYPVTNAEYKRYKDDVGQPFEIPEGKGDHPVVEVSWYDARDYAAWAGGRLLTEAEWEKAASWEGERGRGGDQEARRRRDGGKKLKYPWGNTFDSGRCNTHESGIGTTTPVGKYSPQGDSPYGCADMAGNVLEWTSSLYEVYPYRVDDGREDMASAGSRVLRGGAFHDSQSSARCAARSHYFPDSRYGAYGFRVGVGLLSLPPLNSDPLPGL